MDDLALRRLQADYAAIYEQHEALKDLVVLLEAQANGAVSLLIEIQQDRIKISKLTARMYPLVKDLARYGVGGFMPVEHVATAEQIVAEMEAEA